MTSDPRSDDQGVENLKQRHQSSSQSLAKAILSYLNIAVGQKFDTLSKIQIEGLLKEAGRYHNHKDGKDRAESFFDVLQKRAQKKT